MKSRLISLVTKILQIGYLRFKSNRIANSPIFTILLFLETFEENCSSTTIYFISMCDKEHKDLSNQKQNVFTHNNLKT